MKYLNKYKLFENPDTIVYKGKSTNWMSDSAISIPFGYIDGDFLIGEVSESHGDMLFYYTDNYGDRNYFKYPGRVFLKAKIITFWIFPSPEEFKKIINEMGNAFGYDLWKANDWKVEILMGDMDWEDYTDDDEKEVEYIPIKDYIGSEERSEEELNITHGKYKSPIDIGYTPKVKKWKDWMIPAKESINLKTQPKYPL